MKRIKLSNAIQLSATLLLVLSLVSSSLSLLVPYTASAASEFDNTIQIAETLEVSDQIGNASNKDLSFNWSAILNTDQGTSYQGEYVSSNTLTQAEQDSFNTAIETGDWAAIQVTNQNGEKWIHVMWTEEKTHSQAFSYEDVNPSVSRLAVTPGTGVQTANISYYDGYGIEISKNHNDLRIATSDFVNSSNPKYNPFITTFATMYPEGYDGVDPPSGADPPSDGRQVVRPDISWDVDNKEITLSDVSVPPFEDDYRIRFIATVGTFETQTYFYEGEINPSGSATFSVDSYDFSSIQAWYALPSGERFADTPEYDFRETVVTFEIDGSSFTGTTEGSECDEDDLCTPTEEPEYEDCLSHGADLIAGFQCIVGNAIKFIGNFFASLFKPDPRFTSQMVDLFKNFTTDTYGLTAVLSAPFGLLSNIQEQSYSCSPIVLDVPYVSDTISLPCMGATYQSNFGNLFTIYQIVATAVISYYVLLGILVQVKNMKDPENDRIEAHQL